MWVNAPWWEVYGAQLRAEDADRAAWVDAIARAWCLVRTPDALSPAQLADQTDMVDRLFGRKFYRTNPVYWPGHE